ncbi:uncharacterized protein [Symphalangus syndactylus]|uniref:uncharacterized protein n=1 Tax=Symphalangus syndactylus TaxID=9590 RepID=UPI0030042EF9
MRQPPRRAPCISHPFHAALRARSGALGVGREARAGAAPKTSRRHGEGAPHPPSCPNHYRSRTVRPAALPGQTAPRTSCPQDHRAPFAGLRTGPPRSPPAQNERADSPWTHEATAPRGEKGRLIPPALGEDDSLGGSQGSECYPGRKLRTALRKLHVDSTQSPGWKREGHSQSCFAGAVSLPTALKEPLGKAATSGLWGPKEAKWQSGTPSFELKVLQTLGNA